METPSTVPPRIRVLDVVRHVSHRLAPDKPMLRVPYDLFRPAGPVRLHQGMVHWTDLGGNRHSGRFALSTLGEAHVGERVLLQMSPRANETWWLCEVEGVGQT